MIVGHTYLLVICEKPKQTTASDAFLQIQKYVKPNTLFRGSVQKGNKKESNISKTYS